MIQKMANTDVKTNVVFADNWEPSTLRIQVSKIGKAIFVLN